MKWRLTADEKVKTFDLFNTYCTSCGANNSYRTNYTTSALMEKFNHEKQYEIWVSVNSINAGTLVCLPLFLVVPLALLCPLVQSLLEAPANSHDKYLHTSVYMFKTNNYLWNTNAGSIYVWDPVMGETSHDHNVYAGFFLRRWCCTYLWSENSQNPWKTRFPCITLDKNIVSRIHHHPNYRI